ncbi:hypothetical protein CF8_0142 [Aeromonas phage CF8]|nr:hypothetical protein CF8_0142 [Aeromonas phage CF8]
MRDPRDNPFDPNNLAFHIRRNYFSRGVVEYSTKPGEWGYCQFITPPGAYPWQWLKELSDDWLSRTYDVSLDPHPSIELRMKAATKFNLYMQTEPERLSDLDEETKALYVETFKEYMVPADVKLN